ncbi:hypothetical protein [Hymenobacter chitinivorans]|uniref:Uncharacterized protein n=1 Tax=Hymenobacter chitinivorans DSM 11115 TaxID=1121954 RepID=A0A2M9AST7_9BACT|nr:hypothetical protein [Hymenobacter chitinivorans]PJJ48737.1 hypothetical protein CLV45_4447 [Hymenobacter chitinivorans DSM 11115]
MLRILLLIGLLLCPCPGFAKPMEALGLANALPFLLAFVLVLLLGVGLRAVLADFQSERENPRPFTIVLVLLGGAVGLYVGSVFSATLKPGNGFPNVLTQVYVPLAGLLIGLKKIRLARQQSMVIWWTGIVGAALLTLVVAADGMLQPPSYSRYQHVPPSGAWLLLGPAA